MTNRKYCDIVLPEPKNNYFTERNRIMKIVTSAFAYRECQAIFQSEEYSFAKHAHFQDKQKNRNRMIC